MYWKTSLVLFCLTLKMVFGLELQCTIFQYQEQMIEKMENLEILVQKMKDDMTALQRRVMDDMTTFQRRVMNEIESLKVKVEAIKVSTVTPRVVFYAKEVTNTVLVNGVTFIYKTIMLNEGQGYDNTTGRFTAPVEGTYLFTVQLCIQNGVGNLVYYAIVLDGVEMKRGFFRDDDNAKCHTADVILILKSGAQVWVTGPFASGELSQRSDHWNTFSGALLHK